MPTTDDRDRHYTATFAPDRTGNAASNTSTAKPMAAWLRALADELDPPKPATRATGGIVRGGTPIVVGEPREPLRPCGPCQRGQHDECENVGCICAFTSGGPHASTRNAGADRG